MNIASEVRNMITYVTNIYNSLVNYGATIQGNKNIQNISNTVNTLPSVGRAWDSSTNMYNDSTTPTGGYALLIKKDSNMEWTNTLGGTEIANRYNVQGIYRRTSSTVSSSSWTHINTQLNASRQSVFVPNQVYTNASIMNQSNIPNPVTNFYGVVTGKFIGANGAVSNSCMTGLGSNYVSNYAHSTDTYTGNRDMKKKMTVWSKLRDLSTRGLEDFSYWYSNESNAANIVNIDTTYGKYMRYMHYNSKVASAPDYSTSNVINAEGMFYNCRSLTTIPNYSLTKVQDASNMFCNCNRLTGVPSMPMPVVSNAAHMFFNCQNITTAPCISSTSLTNTVNMFYYCGGMTNFPAINTYRVTNAAGMFRMCYSWNVTPYNYNLSNVINMSNMFATCVSIPSFPSFNTIRVQDMSHAFEDCRGITTAPTLYYTANVTNMANMLKTCTNITSTYNYNMNKVTNTFAMFCQCYNLQTIPNFNLVNVLDTQFMFMGCMNLTSINNINVNNSRNTSGMFYSCQGLNIINYGLNFRSSQYTNEMFAECANLKYFEASLNMSNCINASLMFSRCFNLVRAKPEITTTDTDILNLNNCINAAGMFFYCPNLTTIPYLRSTNNILYASEMFYNCSNLVTVAGDSYTSHYSWDFPNLVNSYRMFYNCRSMKQNWVLTGMQNVVNAAEMFYNCSNINSLTTVGYGSSPMNLVNMTNSCNMFYNCRNLTAVETGGTASNLVNAYGMFTQCHNLTLGNALHFNSATNLLDTSYMFSQCSNLTAAPYVNYTYNLTNTTYMFEYCTNLTSVPYMYMNSVTNMFGMYFGCEKLSSIGGTLNLNNIKCMTHAFEWTNISSLPSVRIGTTNVHMGDIFANCKNLTTANFVNYGKAASDLYGAFYNCTKLNSVTLGGMYEGTELAYCNDVSSLFCNCVNLKEVLESDAQGSGLVSIGRNTTGVNAADMFYNCTNLTKVHGFSIYNCTNVTRMFYNCVNLTNVGNGFGFTDLFSGANIDFSYCNKLDGSALYSILLALPRNDNNKSWYITFSTYVNSSVMNSYIRGLYVNKGWTIRSITR